MSFLDQQAQAVAKALAEHPGIKATGLHQYPSVIRDAARSAVDAMRKDQAHAQIEIQRFRDVEADTWTVWTRGSLWECFQDFADLAGAGIGDMRSQDTEKGYAAIRLTFTGYDHD